MCTLFDITCPAQALLPSSRAPVKSKRCAHPPSAHSRTERRIPRGARAILAPDPPSHTTFVRILRANLGASTRAPRRALSRA
eukprot:6188431-Pleurochrysis_carterae.AAC.1